MMNHLLPMVFKVFGAFLAIFSFAVVQDTPRKYVFRAGLVGAIAGFVYLIALELNAGDVMASFLSAFAAALVSHTFARIFKTPVTLFLVAGILLIVPGAGMYRSIHFLLEGNETQTAFYLTQTIEIAGGIALAIFVMDTLFRAFRKGDWKQNSLEYVRKPISAIARNTGLDADAVLNGTIVLDHYTTELSEEETDTK